MDDVTTHMHLHGNQLILVGIVISFFFLAIICFACSLNPKEFIEECFSVFRSCHLSRCCCCGRRRRQGQVDDDDDDDDNNNENEPSPQVFETLNELIFFESPDDDDDDDDNGGAGFWTTTTTNNTSYDNDGNNNNNNNNNNDALPTKRTMDQIFPDLFGTGWANNNGDVEEGAEQEGTNNNELREPLL
jgi:hypothetical protein